MLVSTSFQCLFRFRSRSGVANNFQWSKLVGLGTYFMYGTSVNVTQVQDLYGADEHTLNENSLASLGSILLLLSG